LGVALGFNLQFDEAVCALNDAIGVLQTRIELLKTEKESKGKELPFFLFLYLMLMGLGLRFV